MKKAMRGKCSGERDEMGRDITIGFGSVTVRLRRVDDWGKQRQKEREGKNRIEEISGEAVLTTTLCCTT